MEDLKLDAERVSKFIDGIVEALIKVLEPHPEMLDKLIKQLEEAVECEKC